jgi:hypothetical protein
VTRVDVVHLIGADLDRNEDRCVHDLSVISEWNLAVNLERF